MTNQYSGKTMLAAILITSGAACSAAPASTGVSSSESVDQSALATVDGLKSIPGFKSTNGLTGVDGVTSVGGVVGTSGLTVIGGVTTVNGLNQLNTSGAPTVIPNGGDLMNSAAGRSVVSFMVKCALPTTESITRKDSSNNSYTFTGEDGVAPQWYSTLAGACGEDCEEWVSACMMARANVAKTCNILLTSDVASIGPTRTPAQTATYTLQTGAYFGNLFTPAAPTGYVCQGGGAPVQGASDRCYGTSNPSNCPFTIQSGSMGPCTTICKTDANGLNNSSCTVPAGLPGAGKTWTRPITTYEFLNNCE